MLNRREAIERITLLLGGALSPQLTSAVLGQVTNTGASLDVSDAQKLLLSEVADVIIPTTNTPGAKAAGVEDFIIRVMRDCYVLEDQKAFYDGLAQLEAASKSAHGKSFVDLDADTKIAVVKDSTKSNKPFFKQMKDMTVTGYFISEIGATQALVYLPIPGKFEGDVLMKPGQKAWAISR